MGIVTPPAVDFAGIQKGERTTGIEVMSNRAFLLNLDTLTFKAFQDRRVRQALNYAVDNDAIVKNTLNGYGRVLATSVILLAVVVAAALGAGLAKLILVLTVVNWVVYARVVRAETLVQREQEFVQAASLPR